MKLRKKLAGVIPFGWREYPEDTSYLEPVAREQRALRIAKHFIEIGYTWRSVNAFLKSFTNRHISLQGTRIAVAKVTDPLQPEDLYGVAEPPKKAATKVGRPKKPLDEDGSRNYHYSRKQKEKLAVRGKIKRAKKELEPLKKEYEKAKEKVDRTTIALKAVEKAMNKGGLVEMEQIELAPPTAKESLFDDDRPILFEPNPGPQTEFLAATEKEVFYGGARGGGKSYSLIVDPLRYVDKEAHRALILRRTMPELRDLINHTHKLYKPLGGKWREQEKEWRFPSGARIEFGYAETATDALRYQGQAYSWIGIDELPQYPDSQIWNDLRGSLRTADPSLPTYMRATGNPGNVGSDWVKQMFIEPAPWGERFYYEVDMPDGSVERISRRFIPAKLTDNPYLTRTRSYMAMLASLPDVQRRQWLEGDWDAWDGAAFPEFRREIHTCEPFEIPNNWVRFRACDWGYSSAFAVLWFAVDYEDNLWVYREFYGNHLTADVFAREVLKREAGERIQYGVMDASVWARRGDVGPSIVEQMAKEGLRWRPSDRSVGSRKSGKFEVHRRLRVQEDTGQPKLKIFTTCKQIIRDIPTLPLDENDPEDVDTKANDHTYDAARYGCMSRPLGPQRIDWLTQAWENEKHMPSDIKFGY
jgi:hypothetical protein